MNLERKAESAAREENAAQKGLYEAEADREIRRCEQKGSEIAFYETHRELESQRMQQHQSNQWADQAQREKMNSCGELEVRSRLYQESHMRTCQEIEELRFVEKKQIGQGKLELMNCLCITRGILQQ